MQESFDSKTMLTGVLFGLALASLALPMPLEAQGGPKGKGCSPKALLSSPVPVSITFASAPDGEPPLGIEGDGEPYASDVQAQLGCSGNIQMANFVDYESTGRTLTFDFTHESQDNDGTRCDSSPNGDCKASFVGGYHTTTFGWFNVNVDGGAICMNVDEVAPATMKVLFEHDDVGFTVAFNPDGNGLGYSATDYVQLTRTSATTWDIRAPGVMIAEGDVGNLGAAKVKRAGPTNEGNFHLPFAATVTCEGGEESCTCPGP